MPYDVKVSESLGSVVGPNAQVTQYFQSSSTPSPSWPVRVGRAPLLADAFQERGGLQERISAVLDAGEAAVVTQVVTGDGGTGKTQLAVATWRRWTGSDGVDLAVWVTASSRSSIISTYAAGAVALGLAVGSQPKQQAEALLGWLSGTERGWLVVLDDLADPADLVGLWPDGAAGRVVVTTRSRDAALFSRGRRRVDVDVFTAAESLAYLTAKLTPTATDAPVVLREAGELAADLGQLPLALGQAAAVIANDAISCADYRTLLADRTSRLADLLPPDPGDEHLRAVAATWSLAIERADRLAPAVLAGRMALLASLLDPNGIPEPVLLSEPARTFLADPAPDEPTARRALRNLHRLSVITHDPTAGPRAVRMHALAQRATREHADPETLDRAVTAAADALLHTWPPVESDPPLGQALRSNTTALRDHAGERLWSTDGHRVLFKAGRSLGEAGLVADAVNYWQQTQAHASRVLEPPWISRRVLI